MKKNRILKVFILFFAVSLLSSAVVVQASSQKNQVNTKNDVGTQASLAEDLVYALFTDDTHTALIPGVTQATIDTARTVVNLLFPSPLKTTLLNLLNTADNLLLQGQLEAAKVTAATNAVNNLFTDGNHTALKVGISIGDINTAQGLVDGLADPLVRAPLNALLVIANNLLDVLNLEVEARAAVDGLFTDSTHVGLKLDITQGDINNAKSLVDALTNVALKAELNLLIASAQIMIDLRSDEQQARDAVYALFSDSMHTTIKVGLTQAEINAAKALVDALNAGSVKTELTMLITSAQSQLDGQTAEQTATALVNALFTDGTHTAIVAGLTQTAIDNARNVVNGLPAGQVKGDLTALVNTAQGFLDTRNAQAAIVADAQAAVDGLFTDSTHTQIKANLTQANIDAAQAKVNLVADAGIKGDLNELIQTAQDLLDEREDQDAIDDAAKAAVYALFSDGTHTTIKTGLTQAEINAAQVKVNLMQASTLKAELNLLIASAQTQLNLQSPENIAIAIVNALFTDDSHTALIDGITQAMIDNARNVVNALPNSAIKDNLLILVNLAQNLYDQASETPAEQEARTAVNNLFADVNHTAIKDTTTQAMITDAKAKVDALAAGSVKTELTGLVVKAQDLLDERNATNAVNNLFTDGTHTVIKPGITQATIDAAKALVNALKPGQVKTDLTVLVDKAQDLFDETPAEREARVAVDDLFTDNTYTAIKDTTTQATINAAKAKVNALPAGETKTELTLLVQKAQDLLDERNATNAVNNLFTDGNHTAIKPGTTQATINAAKSLVDALKPGQVKTDLTALVVKAQDFLDVRNEGEATVSVDALFTDNTHTAIKDTTTQAMITAAKAKVDALKPGQVKTDLTVLVVKAQDLLDQRNEAEATVAVDALFTDNTHTAIKDTTTQAMITAAKAKVDALKPGQVKTDLTVLVVKAQDLLDERNATNAVNNLFTDGTHTAIKPGVTQATINAAKALVNALKPGQIKTDLLALVQTAQDLFNETPAEREARVAVNNLFTDITHTAIKDTTNQAMITAAKAKVNALPAGEVKTELTALVVKAQDLLDERNATNAVNNLFTDAGHNAIKPETTQATINAAKALVDALKPGSVKTEMYGHLQEAQDFLDQRNEAEATVAVDALFTDNTHTAIKDTTTQAMITAAKVKVDALKPGLVKTNLTVLIIKAQDLLDERNATNAVNNLFTDANHDDIKPETTQATINAAKALVDALKLGPVKTELYGHLQEAQDFLDRRNEAEATAAVDALFTDNTHTAIKDTTTQVMITAAKAKVDALKPSQVKTDLTILVIRAQDLYDEREVTIIVEGLFVDNTHATLKPGVFQSTIDAARLRVNALRAGQVKTYLLELLDIAQDLLDQNQPEPGDEYNFWNGKGTYWYRYTASKKWWNWKITTSKYTTLTYFASHRCVSDEPERLNCATLDRRYDFTTDQAGKIIGQLYHKWDVKGLIYSYREFTLNPTLNRLIKTYDRESRYYSNTRTKSIAEQNKRLTDDTLIKQNRVNYQTNGLKKQYHYFNYTDEGIADNLDKVVYNSSGEKRTRGSSKAYFYSQSYNASGKRTGTYRWTYNTKGQKVNRIKYGPISY